MKLTLDFLEEKKACKSGIDWFSKQSETDPIKLIKNWIDKKKHLDWANWLIVRVMEYRQYVEYAIFAAEQVIDIFDKKYPDDKRPRLAIDAAKKCLENPSAENKKAAAAADYAAAAASYAAASYAAYAAAYAAYAAVYAAASYAAYAAYAAVYAAASYAAYAAAYAAYAAAYTAAAADAANAYKNTKTEMQIKILKYGLEILK